MDELYFDPARPGSLAGKETFFKHLKLSGKPVPSGSADVFPRWEAYTLHRPIGSRKFPRNKTVAYTLDAQWQADLADVGRLASKNKGTKFILTVIDVFSRYAWARALKNKTGSAIADAFRNIFETEGRVPFKVQTDQGKEFLNKDVRALFDEYDVKLFFTYSPDIKAALVERLNRTLKTRLYRYMTHQNSEVYLPVLQDIVRSYNQTVHSALSRTPASVTEGNVKEVYAHQYRDQIADSFERRRKEQRPKFRVGDNVRISRNKVPFNKGYLANWSEEVFTVSRIIFRRPVVYKLQDLDRKDIGGIFYTPELQLVKGFADDEDDTAKTVDVLRRKVNKKTGDREVLIQYRGYPKETAQKWIKESDLAAE